MKTTPILSLLALSIGASNAATVVPFSTAINAGTGLIEVTDTSTSMIFATIATTGQNKGVTADGIWLNAQPNSGTGDASYTISYTDPAYSISGVEWNARGGTPVELGGSTANTTVSIRVNTSGTLTTGIQNWTWVTGGAAITNGVGTPYTGGSQFTHDVGGTITNVDHWNLVSSSPSDTGTVTYRKIGPNSAVIETATVAFEFCVVPEPSSTMILGLAGLGLLGRRKR